MGAGAALGISAAQEGGVGRAFNDGVIQAKINELWLRHDLDIFRKLDLTVNNGRVLITGVVQNPEHRVEAVRLAWQPEGVKQVINEIRVADSDGFPGFVRDNWISARLRTAITLDRNIQSLNYNIDTVQGIVYLMGYAQNQRELNHVMEKARTTPNVKQVISYVKIIQTTPDVNWDPQTGYDQGRTPAAGTDPRLQDASALTPAPGPAPVEAAPLDNSAYEKGGYETDRGYQENSSGY